MYDNKHGINKTEEETKERHKKNLRQTILAGIEERDDSLDSDTILDDKSTV